MFCQVEFSERALARGLSEWDPVLSLFPGALDPPFWCVGVQTLDQAAAGSGSRRTRAHSVGAVALKADLLGFALSLNALSRHRHRKREAARAAPVAA